MKKPKIISVNISPGGIPKLPVPECRVLEGGLEGDGHAHDKHIKPKRAFSILDIEIIEQLKREGYSLVPGATGENLTVEDLNVQALEPGDLLEFEGGVALELSEPRKPCFVLDSISPQLKTDILGRCGYMAYVRRTGILKPGEGIRVKKSKPQHAADR